ncbi:DUF1761 domain-containing protein [Candidatus Woesearchaeota archaeon]|nr:DUF1761 domain-containing protein [Candidatus Woesearchaeota archaeon]
MAPPVDINYWAVLVAAAAAMAVGFLWYGPLFGKQWMKLTGIDKLSKKEVAQMKEKGKKSMGVTFITSLVMSYILAHFVDYVQAGTIMDGIILAFWLWIGFFATTQLGVVLWENKPLKLYLMNTSHYLVSLAVMASILAVWA